MAMDPQAMFNQLSQELNVARAQIAQLSAAQDSLRAEASSAIAASEARTAQLLQQQGGGGGGKGDHIDLVDFKVAKPADFYGKREESWKVWSRAFKTYCNVRCEGFKRALDWAESYSGQIINEMSIDEMGWPKARIADSKLYDFLSLQCKGDALVLIEHYEGLGFEAWRQLTRRYMPSGGQFELDMMSRLMNPTKAARISDLPATILRFERDLQTYESRTGRAFPEEWKAPTFLRILPDSHREELVRRFQLGMRSYSDLVANVRGFSQEAWFSTKGPNDMDMDQATYHDPANNLKKQDVEWQNWFRAESWDNIYEYWAQQNQELDYMGRKGGRKGAKGEDTRKCYWCDGTGHIVRDCPAKKRGQPQKPALAAAAARRKGNRKGGAGGRAAGALDNEDDDYQTELLGSDRDAGYLEREVCTVETEEELNGDEYEDDYETCYICGIDADHMPVINVVTEDVDLSGADYVPEPQAEHIMRVENLVVDAEGWPVTPPGLARASTSGALSAQPAQQAATHFVAQAPQSASAQTHGFASVFHMPRHHQI